MKNKYKIVLIALCIILFGACKDKGSGGEYVIDADLTGVTSPEVYLVSFTQPQLQLDTIKVKNGKFTYKNNADTLEAIIFYMNSENIWVTLWVKNGDHIKLSGDITYPELLEVDGGDINNLLADFKLQHRDIIKKKQDLQENLRFSQDENLSIQSSNELYGEILQIEQVLKNDAANFVEENPSSVASLVLIYDYIINYENPQKVKSYLDLLTGDAKNNSLYPIVEDVVNKLVQTHTGSPAPPFSVVDVHNNTLTPDDYSNQYLLINYSLPDNDSCKRFRDELAGFMNDKTAASLHVLTLSLEKDSLYTETLPQNLLSKWHYAIDEDGWNSAIVKAYNATTITDNILIGDDGTIKARNIPVDSIRTIISNQ